MDTEHANQVSRRIHAQREANQPKVRQLADNQFEIVTSRGIFFQSYQSVICFKPQNGGRVLLDERFWNYSKTTSKYRNQFLNESTKETERKIEAGVYRLTNLN